MRVGIGLAAGAALLLSGLYLVLSLRLPLGTVEEPGPAFFPLLTGLLLLAGGLGLAGEVRRGRQKPASVEPRAARRVGVTVMALIGFCLALPLAGYPASMFGLLLVTLRLFGLSRWTAAAAASLALTAASWYVFAAVLGVPLPAGRWRP
jgi:putative tricarboxylic transport membrane protein